MGGKQEEEQQWRETRPCEQGALARSGWARTGDLVGVRGGLVALFQAVQGKGSPPHGVQRVTLQRIRARMAAVRTNCRRGWTGGSLQAKM